MPVDAKEDRQITNHKSRQDNKIVNEMANFSKKSEKKERLIRK